MPRKINRLLIPLILTIPLIFGAVIISVSGAPIHNFFFPLISDDLSAWIGPYGGYVVTTVFDPINPQVVYAGTWGSGVYKSADGGLSWQPINQGLSNYYINSFSIDPVNPTILYAGTYKDQVFKSKDGGENWSWSGSGMQDQAIVYTIAIDPLSSSTIYAGTRGVSNNGQYPWNGVIYKSVNAGNTWQAVLSDVGGTDHQDWAYHLVVNPSAHNTIYAAFHEHGPYRSLDSGNSWSPIREGIEDLTGRAILIDPETSNPSTLYYGVWRYDSVYKSTDGGDSWLLSNNGIYYTHVFGMVIDRLLTDTIYLATFNHGVLKTMDGGETWDPAGLQDDKIYTLVIKPGSSKDLLAGTYGDGIYRSSDGGVKWQHSNTGIDNANPTSVIISPTNPLKLYASIYGAGVLQTAVGGHTWDEMNTGLGDKFVSSLIQDPAHPELIYALTNQSGLYRNNLNTSTGWVSLGEGLPLSSFNPPAYTADHPFATFEMQEFEAAAAQITGTNQLTNVSLQAMVFSPSDPQIAYLGTLGAGVYQTTDAGTTWQPAGLEGQSILNLAVDTVDSDIVYASTDISGSLKISFNGGDVWEDSKLPVIFYSLATTPALPGSLYAGTSQGIYRYSAGNWNLIGLEGRAITALSISAARPGLIYAGTTAGAYYSLDFGLTWKPVDQNIANLTIQYIRIDPVYPNWAYFCTTTHGIYFASLRF